VFAGDENFTVTEPDDIKFPEYFYQRYIAEDAAGTTKTERRPHQPHLPLDGTADLIGG
jgi:hypothetical protein